jgi:hypothetical protein
LSTWWTTNRALGHRHREGWVGGVARDYLDAVRDASPTAAGDDPHTVHGFVSMEVFGLLRPIAPAATSWWEKVLAAELGRLGLTPA